ncbi:hypothetical protein HPB50_004166 [Hyalomma asiaticum]|uniref:Uncharacterized protein n=1 Tax=Hyalomma asiaticum TaxID=266040 RepID=A0ACB7SVJ8_HYAAI|nr:hypothetical protein HPB50_004166 [Hyalomma asiaticum]
MAATNSVESVMPHARRSGTGSRPRRRREDLRSPSAETSESPTTASWERQDDEGTTASSDRAAGVRSKETVRQHPNDGRTSVAAAV